MVQIAQPASTPASAPAPGEATRAVMLPERLVLRRGGVLEQVEIAYETWGELSAAADNAVLVFTGLSPGPHAASSPADPSAGWWEYMIGPGKPIDSERHFIICVNSLGSCFGSTGPSSVNPATGKPYRLDFPELTIEDIAAATHAALRELGIDRLHTAVGASLGGMSALAYAMMFPAAVQRLVVVSAAVHATTFAIADRALQREIIRSDPDWRGGDYPLDRPPLNGLRLARKLGLMSYRSAVEWQHRFGRERMSVETPDEPFGMEFQIESYLEANARKFMRVFDANSYLYLSRAMDWFDAAVHGESLSAAMGRIEAREALVIGVRSDFLFPVAQQRELAELLSGAGCEVELAELDSVQGHDAFLVDKERFAPCMRRFFDAADAR